MAIRDDAAQVDVVTNGFWRGTCERAYFDVRLFNPYAVTNRWHSLSSVYKNHENEKKRAESTVENQRYRAKFLYSPGLINFCWHGKRRKHFYTCLASLLAEKWNQFYSTTINWLRCILSFFANTFFYPVLSRSQIMKASCHQIGKHHTY